MGLGEGGSVSCYVSLLFCPLIVELIRFAELKDPTLEPAGALKA